MPIDYFPTTQRPYLPALERLALALALGLFVGLERQRRGKEAGVRTFAFAGLVGCLGGLLGDPYALTALALVGLLVIFLTVHALRANHDTELTTSAALLAYKESFIGFSMGLTDVELRSAILLAILACVIYPALPEGALDPWNLIEPRG